MIANTLTNLDAKLAALEQRREKTRALKQAMMQVSAVTTNRPARVELNQPVKSRKFTFSFQKSPVTLC